MIKLLIIITILQEFLLIPIAVYLFLKKRVLVSSYLGKIATFTQYLFIIFVILYGMTYLDEIFINIFGLMMFIFNSASGIHHFLKWFKHLRT